MAWRNQLEPARLVAHFVRHPPQDFSLLQGLPAPAFRADFDLLTTADDALKARLRGLPGFGRWSRWLRIQTAFIGTTVTEYAPLPLRDVSPQSLAQAVREGPGRQFRLSIIKDIPQQSPLLDDVDNAYAQALADACETQGFVMVEGQALAYVPIDFASLDDYLGRLSSGRRRDLRRKLRSRAGLDVRCVHTGVAFADDARVDAYVRLYQAVYAQSEVHFDCLSRDFLAALLRDGDSRGVVFEYRRAGSDELLGWNLCYVHDGRLVDKYIGLDYPAARDMNLYFVSWMENLQYALAHGLTHYVAGWTDPEVKRSLGAQFTFTRHAVYVRQPLLRALARRFSSRFESDGQWRERVQPAATGAGASDAGHGVAMVQRDAAVAPDRAAAGGEARLAAMAANPPVVLDLDGAVGPLPGEHRVPLAEAWQETLRFGCGLARLHAFRAELDARLQPFAQHGPVFLGSGDFHHLSWPLIERCIAACGKTARQPLRVVVLDNHPDNMRFPFGVHCGSWVRRVAMLPQVSHVHVVGITSGDIGLGHAWENVLTPLRAGRLTYWSTGVDTGWARWLGLQHCFRRFDDADALCAAITALLAEQGQDTYLSIDKDVFLPSVVRTNWDQGVFDARHGDAVLAALRGQIVGCDVTGEVSEYRYRTAWKRWLSACDGQQTGAVDAGLPDWQAGQAAFNLHLLAQLGR